MTGAGVAWRSALVPGHAEAALAAPWGPRGGGLADSPLGLAGLGLAAGDEGEHPPGKKR